MTTREPITPTPMVLTNAVSPNEVPSNAALANPVPANPVPANAVLSNPAPINAKPISTAPFKPEPADEEPASEEPPVPEPIYTDPANVAPGRPLASVDFVIVDVETTGWLAEQASITELAAVRVSPGRPTAEFSALVNPGAPIPEDIVALTGITDAMVRYAPPIGAVLPGFLAFARGCVLTAHNAPFDVGFLTAACGSCRIPWPPFPVLDTAALARLMLDETEVPDCKLATLADFFGAQTRPCHRALADAQATAHVLQGLLGRLTRAGVRTLAEISA
jgi:DNA polymerase III epsilon subunit family exonuclease